MLAIEFMHGQDCARVYNRVKKELSMLTAVSSFSLKMYKAKDVIHCEYEGSDLEWEHGVRPYMAAVLTDDIVQRYEVTLIEKLIKERYHFRDPNEREQIMELARSLLAGERPEVPEARKSSERKTVLYHAIYDHLSHRSVFYWNPFLTFCTGNYERYLKRLAEIVIEEYQMEQEYQTVVDSLRSHVEKASAITSELHLWYESRDYFLLVDQDGDEWGPPSRLQYIKAELVFEEGLQPSEMIISPIASIAPKRLYIYTAQDDGVIQTLRTIFQERIHVRSFEHWLQ
ncbi:putative sporulation protein YtxC [Geomicrobium halophilum]|uniref:Putative sporulation protein YtxC n=1 Tax=Geomicrobium halophilum TaxID=549000 RepID=A0A841PPJ9_9BACL|nr:putative sporulation protein YtxC [Geomicrobium halophilum]MBB6448211.1 putative sporulation protein YtxC [Geomicrobium halophilum]